MLVDSHCHIDFPVLFDRLPQSLELMQAHGVSTAVCVGVELEKFPGIVSLTESCPNILATVGVHPSKTGVREPTVKELVTLAQHPRVIAIGETGLDYYWHKDMPKWQRRRFRAHIHAARDCGKRLIIHSREAIHDVLRIMKEERAEQVGGIMHCFSENWEVAKEVLDMGFYISISGIVTFKNAKTIREVARLTPLNKLLIETDAPYLAPDPYRGRINQPGYVKYVAEEIAHLREISFDEVAKATTENFFHLISD